MALYSGYVVPTSTTINTCHFAIEASATAQCSLLELYFKGIYWSSGSAIMGLGRNGTLGTKTLYTTPLPFDSLAPACNTAISYTWSVAPTQPTQYFRMITGNNIWTLWQWPRGLTIAASSGVGLWSLTAVSTVVQVNAIVLDE